MVAVRELRVYPVKSMGGIALNSAEVTATGLRHDREFMLVRPDGRHLSQREEPELALLRPDIDGVKLSVHAADAAVPFVHVPVDGPPVEVILHGRPVQGIDQGDAAAAWFSETLGRACRLVRFTGERLTARGHGVLQYADGEPLSVLSRASFDDLNRRVDAALAIDRFRPNIVLEGVEPYGEDALVLLRIGGVEIELVRPCARCVIINIDQDSARTTPDPLRTLATYRTRVVDGDREITFGRLGVPRAGGVITVGDSVETVEAGT